MKFNKIISALFGAAVLAGAYACTDEVKYDPAPKYDGDEVFFSNELVPEEINIPQGAETVNVTLSRIHDSGELTVGLIGSVTDPEGNAMDAVFSVPTEVTFAAGSLTTEIPIGVIFSDVVEEEEYTLSLKLNTDQASPYGTTEASIVLTYAPWSELELVSTAEYTGAMGNPFSGEYLEGLAYVTTSITNPNKVMYILEGPRYTNLYFNYELSMDKTECYDIDGVQCPRVSMPLTDTHYAMSSGNNLMFVDAYTYIKDVVFPEEDLTPEIVEGTMAKYDLGRSYYNPETGTFYVFALAVEKGDEKAGWYPTSTTVLQLPGYSSYDITFSVVGNYVHPTGLESVILSAVRSADVASYSYEIIEGNLDDTQIDAAIAALKANVDAVVYTEESRTFTFELTKEATYTIVAVGYDEAGEAVYDTSFKFNAKSAQHDVKWTHYGTAIYSDVVMSNFYNNVEEGNMWDGVVVQVSTETPGYYRLVNPYKDWGLIYESDASIDMYGNYYVYINAENPKRVYVEQSEIGIDLGKGYGPVLISSLAYNNILGGSSLAKEYLNKNTGTMTEDGVITLPKGKMVYAAAEDGTWRAANANEDFYVEIMSDAAAVKKGVRVNRRSIDLSPKAARELVLSMPRQNIAR